jgi:hypothetical protein
LVDEFGPGHPFGEQVANVDRAVRDCQSVAQRYSANDDDDDNHVYQGFRSGQLLDRSQVGSISLGPYTYTQVSSKYASVSSLISIYAHPNKSDTAGEAHPGLSSDTRFDILARTALGTLEQHIRRETDWERDEHVRERDQLQQQQQQLQIVCQEGQGTRAQRPHHRQTRRGRRGPRNNCLEQQQREVSANRSGQMSESLVHCNQGVQVNGRHGSGLREQIIGNHPAEVNDRTVESFGESSRNQGQHREFQPGIVRPGIQNPSQIKSNHSDEMSHRQGVYNQVRQHHGQGHPEHRIQPQRIQGERPTDLQEHFRAYGLDPRFPMISPTLPPLPPVDFTGIPFDRYPQHLADQILNHVYQVGRPERPGEARLSNQNTEQQWRFAQHHQTPVEISESFNQQGWGRPNEDEHVRPVLQEIEGQLLRGNSSQGVSDGMQARMESYSRRHGPTARRGNREFATFLDEMNQQPPHPETQRLRGDTFNGEPALSLHPPTPTVLHALAERGTIQPRALVNDQTLSVGSRPGPVRGNSFQSGLLSQPTFDANHSRSTTLNESGSTGSEESRGRSSVRSSAADQRRSNVSSVVGGTMLQPRPLSRLTILGDSGVYSCDPSPVAPRDRRLFESRASSPGGGNRVRGQGDHRSASTGYMG